MKEDKISISEKCYQFWAIKHPLLCISIWLICIIVFSIVISELNKK